MIDATQLLVIKQKFYFLKQVFCLNIKKIEKSRRVKPRLHLQKRKHGYVTTDSEITFP